MKPKRTAFLVVLSMLAFFSCKKDTDPNLETFKIVKEVEKITVNTTSATITGTFEFSGKVNSLKVRVGTSEQLFGSDVFVAEVSGKAYSVNITNLHSGTTYHYRYEVDLGAKEDFLTEINDFTTLSESPTVKTIDVTAIDSTTFRVKCETLSGGGQEVTERGICWNTYGDPTMDDETLKHANGGLGQYTLRMENLAMATKYYVRAYAMNAAGIGFGEVFEFRTGSEAMLPQVSTVEVSEVSSNSATCLGNVSSLGGLDLIERGVCWSLNAVPTLNDSHVPASEAMLGVFQVSMSGLSANQTYHVRAYAANAKGTAYGEELTFTTSMGLPTVTTAGVTDVTSTSATGSGTVTDQGASPVTERGICWNTSHDPTTSDSHASNGSGEGAYTVSMTGLTPNQTYYVKAYAKNAQGTAYSAEVEFIAKEGLPVVQTLEATNITSTSATLFGKVSDEGGSIVTERGVCWSTEPIPTISENFSNNGSGPGTFALELNNYFNPGTTYYVRAYAINAQGLSYGNEVSFTTSATLPTVETGLIFMTTVSGVVTDEGGAPVTERGICWSTSHDPTTSDDHGSNGTGMGSYSVTLTNVEPGTTYYVRAYATNSQGTAYGAERSLTTQANLPTVTTGEVTNIAQNSAIGTGNVTDDGGTTVTERGICWSTGHNPTSNDSHATNGTGMGSYTVSMTGLTSNTTYYVRAYAINSAGTRYGNEVSFTTSQNVSAPSVTTSQVTNVTQNSATGGGNVTHDGGANVTERGICWGTYHNPTTNGSHASSGTGTGTFTVNMTGLTSGTTYYVRAYAINSQGTSYGSEVSFTTQQTVTLPTVTTSQVSNITQTTATGGGNVTASGGATVTERGICWSTSHNPTTSSSHATNGSGTGNYTVNMTDLTANTTYYVRAYAINSAGTAYGSEVSFTTTQNVTIPTVTTSQVSNITQTSATGGGNVTSDGGATVTERGVCWSTSHNPTTSGSHATNGTGTGNFTVNMTNLTANTTYYVRAYAINSAGTAYGSEVSFTTLSSGGNAPQGAINGLFTINSSGDQVYFSQGNLQYQASTNTWRFATNQYDYLGNANSNISQTYSGWIDLFGWGTSGWDCGNTYYRPWDSYSGSDWSAGSLYGPPGLYDLTGSYAHSDWGIHNAISNGGNSAGLWRTLTHVESMYIFFYRNTPSGIYFVKAKVNGVNGVILLPDDWDSSYYSLNYINDYFYGQFSSNVISSSVWANNFQSHGAVFLPAAGHRIGTTLDGVGSYGWYWLSSSGSSPNHHEAYDLYFYNGTISPETTTNRKYGCSVRLVHPVQ